MRPLVQEAPTQHSPESLAGQLRDQPGVVLLRSAWFDAPQTRYSFVTARPFQSFRSFGSRCELSSADGRQIQFGNPWHLLDSLMARYELLEVVDRPFPLGGCFGYWGYDLKNFVEPKLVRRAIDDLELPECHVGFYDSLVVFDHRLEKAWIVSTGLQADGSRCAALARRQLGFWQERLSSPAMVPAPRVRLTGLEDLEARVPVPPLLGEMVAARSAGVRADSSGLEEARSQQELKQPDEQTPQSVTSNLSRAAYIALVERAQRYIRGNCFSGWRTSPRRRSRPISTAVSFRSLPPRRNYFCGSAARRSKRGRSKARARVRGRRRATRNSPMNSRPARKKWRSW